MKHKHNFPPFEAECINKKGLINHLKSKIAEGQCVYCQQKFEGSLGVRQHMADVGHAKLDITDFGEYEKYYLWKIEESSS